MYIICVDNLSCGCFTRPEDYFCLKSTVKFLEKRWESKRKLTRRKISSTLRKLLSTSIPTVWRSSLASGQEIDLYLAYYWIRILSQKYIRVIEILDTFFFFLFFLLFFAFKPTFTLKKILFHISFSITF